jgi:Spy/CpxP family protein refolding chaperone
MSWTRTGLMVVAVALGMALLYDAQAQDEKPKRPFGGGFGAKMDAPLVDKELSEKLKLTEEQQKKLEKLDKDFAEKTKDSLAKFKEAMSKGFKDKDAMADMREQGQAIRKTRGEFETKVKELLKEDQKKTFEEAIAARPGPGGGPNGRFGGGRVQTVYSPDVQEKLKLTSEQKEKLDKLKKDFDAKTTEVLTDEQKKKFEDIKKEGPPMRRRPNDQ